MNKIISELKFTVPIIAKLNLNNSIFVLGDRKVGKTFIIEYLTEFS